MATIKLSSRIANLPVSETIEAAEMSRKLRDQGIDVVDMTLGEPDFNTPEYIKEGAAQAMADNFTHYPPVAGYNDLREAIVDKFKRDNGLEYTMDNIVVSTGAKQTLANIILSLCEQGDEVILPAPYWVSYRALVRLAGATEVALGTSIDSDFKITPEQLEEAINENTRLFIYSSPCNPSGTVYTKDELQALAAVFARHPHVIVVSDEIYEYLVFEGDHESIAQFPEIRDQVIVVNGVSKAYAMTGWRLGYMAAPSEIANVCKRMQSQVTSGASAISQKAAKTAIASGREPVADMIKAFHERRDLILQLLSDIPGLKTNVPAGAFYVMPNVEHYIGMSYEGTTIENASDLCRFILDQEHVNFVTGKAFGADGYVRISFATSNEAITEGMRRFKAALEKLS